MLGVGLAVSMSFCSDEKEGPANYLSVDGTQENLSGAAIFYNDKPDTVAITSQIFAGQIYYQHEIILFAEGATIDTTTGKALTPGYMINIQINLLSGKIDPNRGAVTFHGSIDGQKPLKMWEGFVNLNSPAPASNSDFVLTDVTLEIWKEGDNNIITLKGIAFPHTPGGNDPDSTKKPMQVNGYFKGKIGVHKRN